MGSSQYIANLDVVSLFKDVGMYRFEGDGKHFVTCPWNESHSSKTATETAIWEGMWPQFYCLHAHCAERTIKDVIAYFRVPRHAA